MNEHYTKIIKNSLVAYIGLTILNIILIIIIMSMNNICNDHYLVLNIFDLILYVIALFVLGFFYRLEINGAKENVLKFGINMMVLLFAYLFWHSILIILFFVFGSEECQHNIPYILRIIFDFLLIFYSLVFIIIIYLVIKKDKN